MTTTHDLFTQAHSLLGELMMDGGAMTEESVALVDTWLTGSADKLGAIRAVLAQLKGQTSLLRDEEKRLAARRRSLEGTTAYLEECALALLKMREDFGEEAKVKTDTYTAWVQASASVGIGEDFELLRVPAAYLTEQEPRLNKTEALKALKAGATIPGLALQYRDSVRWR